MAKPVRQMPVLKPKPNHYLREWRKYRQLTQEQLADRVDCSRGLISQYESGVTDLTGSMIHALAHALRCSAGDLFDRNPLKEGLVVDMADEFRALSSEEQQQVIGYVRGLASARKL